MQPQTINSHKLKQSSHGIVHWPQGI